MSAPTTYQQVMLSLNPIGFWPLNESSGTTAYDLIGGHNGTYTNNYALGQTGPPNTFFGGATAAVFDGVSGHVDIPGAPFNITGAVTVVAWVNVLSGPTFDGLFGHGDASWRMTIDGAGQPAGNDGPGLPDATDPIANPGVYDGNYVLTVSGVGDTVDAAREKAYGELDKISVPNSPSWRTDIGKKLEKKLPELHKMGYGLGAEYDE